MGNRNCLNKAKSKKDDEFYTRRTDIEQELRFYKNHFKDKVVYLNCDDPAESEFWQYFVRQFNAWELKGLISTHYDPTEPTYKLEIKREDVDIDLDVVPEEAIKREDIESNGDFRSACCIELLKRSDVVVTNPPFSLFREYMAQLVEYNKEFLVIGNMNAYTYKEIFPLIKDGKVWIGNTHPKEFVRPDGTIKKFGNISWFTNMDITKRHTTLDLQGNYYEDSFYPKYDNYNAIEVSKVCMIPCDYDGVMGVPITYLDQHNPDDFDLLGCSSSESNLFGFLPSELSEDFRNLIKNKRVRTKGSPSKTKPCWVDDGGYANVGYHRLFIKNKHPQPPHKEEEE